MREKDAHTDEHGVYVYTCARTYHITRYTQVCIYITHTHESRQIPRPAMSLKVFVCKATLTLHVQKHTRTHIYIYIDCESLSLKDALTGWSPCSHSYCPFGLWLHVPSHRSKRRSRPASEDGKHGNGCMIM